MPLLTATIVGVIATYLAWCRREKTVALWGTMIQLTITLWSGLMLVTVSATSQTVKESALLAFLSVVPVLVVSALGFTLHFTGRGDWLTRGRLSVLSLFPLSVGLLGLTNGVHNFLLVDPGLDASGTLVYGRGPAFYAMVTLVYAIAATYLSLLGLHVLRSRNVYRKVSFVILVFGLGITLASVPSVFDESPFPHFLLVPYTFLLLGTVLTVSTTSIRFVRRLPVDRFLSLLRGRFDSVVPLARDFVVEEVDNGIIVLDTDGRVVDINSTAKKMIGIHRPVGKHVTDIGTPEMILESGELMDVLTGAVTVHALEDELLVDTPAGERHYDVQISELSTEDGGLAGHVVLLHDITQQKRREEELAAREEELDLLRQVQSRILRHNIRNDLSVIRGSADLLAEQVDDHEHLDRMYEASDDLVSISEKVRQIESVVDRNAETAEHDLRSLAEEVAKVARRQYPEVDIEVTGPSSCHVQAMPKLDVAIKNLLENAVEHTVFDEPSVADAPEQGGGKNSGRPDVAIQLTNGMTPSLTVADQGPGIPDQEIDVLENEQETPLEHGSGIGLWLVKWIVDRSNAELSFETSGEGTEVTIEFTASDQLSTSPGASNSP
jgi:PAS domain S-box-containing protein